MGSILVAIDIESSAQEGVSEIGIAIFPAMKQAPESCFGIQSFYEAHDIRAETFRVRERTFNHRLTEPKQYGNTVLVDSEDKIGQLIEEILLGYTSEKKAIILVGFDLHTELRWISRTHPALVTRFSAWIDIQEVVSEQFANSRQIGLIDTLKALQIKDWRSRFNRHYAANDAIRCLAVLSGLITTSDSLDFTPTVPSKQVLLLSKLPSISWQGSRQHKENPFTVRITTADGSNLPSMYTTPLSVSKLFAKYDLKAVGLNSKTSHARLNGVKFWWLSFHTLHSLEKFIKDFDGMTLEGIELRVMGSPSPGLHSPSA